MGENIIIIYSSKTFELVIIKKKHITSVRNLIYHIFGETFGTTEKNMTNTGSLTNKTTTNMLEICSSWQIYYNFDNF